MPPIHIESTRILRCVGWREWAGLPDLGVEWIKAKIDTGARTSALHASNIEYFREGGRKMVRFNIHPLQRNTQLTVTAEAELLEVRKVRSSVGIVTERPVIWTHLRIGREVWPVELTLVDRDLMGFRMLIGRQAIRQRYLVDPAVSYQLGRIKKSAARKHKRGKGHLR